LEVVGRESELGSVGAFLGDIGAGASAYFPGYLNENFIALQDEANLSRDEILQLARNAFAVSWLAPKERGRYDDALEAYAANAG
jgi:adenosine deaminase